MDLARHASGAGAGAGAGEAWLDAVRPGDELTIVATRRALPAVDRMLAIGDATAFPALARFIEERPSALALEVVASVADLAILPRSVLPAVSPTGSNRVRVRLLEGATGSTAEIIGALSGTELPTSLAWRAGESGMVAAVRRHLLDRGQYADRVQFTGDWRLGGAL